MRQPVDFDASKFMIVMWICTFLWILVMEQQVETKGPYTQHPYQYAGVYPVTVTVTDKYGKKADASLNQRCVCL